MRSSSEHRERSWSRMRRRSLLIAPVIVGALALAACSDDDDSADSSSPSASGASTTAGAAGSTAAPSSSTPTAGGSAVVVGAVLEPTSLDIITQAGASLDQILLDNVYETLLRWEDGEAVAGLAEVPEVSEDGLTYTFTLQEGVTFHDGEPLDSADVVWSLEQARAETSNSASRLASVSAVTAVDESTVEVTLSERDNDFLFNLGRRAGAVLKENATDLGNTAIGSGPFSFVEWNQGSSITLERYDEYWGDAPAISGVTFLYFTDPNAAVTALTTGDVDILTGVNSDLIAPLQENDDFIVNEGLTNGEFTLGMNNSRPPFDNADVRKAVRQAIDKEGFLELVNGFGTIIGGPVPPIDAWYEDLTDVAPYDPEAATALLEGADATDLNVTLTWPNFYPVNQAEYVASQLAEVGITVEIETVEFAVWLEQVFTNADYDMTAVLHVEPRDIANYANPEYYWRYDNAEVQQLIADAKVAETEEEANDLLQQAARLISEDSPVDWLLLNADLTVAKTNVSGYPLDDTASRFDASGIVIG